MPRTLHIKKSNCSHEFLIGLLHETLLTLIETIQNRINPIETGVQPEKASWTSMALAQAQRSRPVGAQVEPGQGSQIPKP